MKRIEKIISKLNDEDYKKEGLKEDLKTLKILLENVESHLKELERLAYEDYKKEYDEGSLTRSLAYGTALMLLEKNMEEGE